MATTTGTKREDSNRSLSMVLKRQPQLYDLHTHLLGMGNASFWIDTILMDENVMPTNATFRNNQQIRADLCPLVWNRNKKGGFVDGREVARFFHYLTEGRSTTNTNQSYDQLMEQIKRKRFSSILGELIKKDFFNELLDRSLAFTKNFSHDVILTLSDLSKSLG